MGAEMTLRAERSAWQDDLGRRLEAYAVQHSVQTRVGDMDGYGHLNAVRIVQYYEDARATFHRGAAGDRVRCLVTEMTVRYLAEGSWPGHVVVGTGVVAIGRTSFVLGQGLFQHGRCVGLCQTVMVHARDGRPFPLPSDYRLELARFQLA